MNEASRTRRAPGGLPRASLMETLRILLVAGGPLFAKGIIVRRPLIVHLLQQTGIERRAVTTLQRLRARYGEGPLLLRIPFRSQAVILSPDHVRRVVDETPDPFETDSSEKHATLAHFESRGSLISRGSERTARREFNERVLESECQMHSLAARMRQMVRSEAERLATAIDSGGELAWGDFKDAWFRLARHAVFGPGARDDKQLTQMLIQLRGDANWAFLKPKRTRLRQSFLARVKRHLDRRENGSLAALIPSASGLAVAPADQVAQWLFAFDAAGIATFRALAMLALHEGLAEHARPQADAAEGQDLPFLRACVLEAVRLWPTTPAILRQTDRETEWETGTMPAGTGILIHVPFLHRDDSRIPFANRFEPGVWLTGEARDWPLVPFSGGPGECPAKNLVLMLASMTLAELLRSWDFRVPDKVKFDLTALPATFDQFSLGLPARARSNAGRRSPTR